jgi:16S rRNA (cytosine1402-N4)-methyltransferase
MSREKMKNNIPHTPVMLNEVLNNLSPQAGEIYLDCTFGAGGYTKAFLKLANCIVIGIDRDKNVQQYADSVKREFGERFSFLYGKFSEADKLLRQININKVDAIIMDLGVSSMQLDEEKRGFSFNKEAKLDMRMDQGNISAYDVINKYSEEELANIIYNYGDEKKSRKIAKRIIEQRKNKSIETTIELANIVRSCFKTRGKIDNATKTFQAIRIFVNDELNELKKALELSKILLNKNGRLIVVTFHSLEDKIVKDFIQKETGYSMRKKNKYASKDKQTSEFLLDIKKAVLVSENEIKKNVRARSAKLRVAIKK